MAQAFKELYGDLPDQAMADVLAWWDNNLDELKANYDKTAKACEDAPLAACTTAVDVIKAYEGLTAWTELLTQGAPLVRADAERRFIIHDTLLIPTPDGAEIAAILVRPRIAQVKRVALLNFTIYARDQWSFADAVKMAAYGYAGVVAYTRGKGRSPGPVVPYIHDGADAATVINWLARQPWSDGRVGMFSGSYNASTHWAAVKHHPKALKAIATDASNAPGIDTPMQGNVFQSFMYYWPFYTTGTKYLDDRAINDREHWQALERQWYKSGRFTVVTNKRDFDLSVDSYERRPDGTYLPLASYLGRASYMKDRSRRHLLSPCRATTLLFESQTLTARRLQPGSRIVAVVGVPKRPSVQINHGTGKDVSDESIADATPLSLWFLAGSYLELGTRTVAGNL